MPSIAVDPANKVQSVMPPAQYIVRESEGDDVVHADDMFKDTNPWDLLPPGWRRRTAELVQSTRVQAIMLLLLALDLVLVIIGAMIEIHGLDKELDKLRLACSDHIVDEEEAESFVDRGLEKTEAGLVMTSSVILALFLCEGLLLAAAYQIKWLKTPSMVFDFVLALVSIILELNFSRDSKFGIIILARMWRYIRLGHGFIEAQHKKHAAEGHQKHHDGGAGGETDGGGGGGSGSGGSGGGH
eukprot:gene1048-25325_t